MKFNRIVAACILVYTLGVYIGIILPTDFSLSNELDMNHHKSLAYLNQSANQLVIQIVLNNLKMTFLNLIGGFSFGIISVVNLFFNGLLLGYASGTAYTYYGLEELMLHLLPHSIEIVGIILSSAVGVNLGVFLFLRYVLDKQITFDYRLNLKAGLLSIIIISISAYLEVYISMQMS